jgi:GT2 family glycosyltransferase
VDVSILIITRNTRDLAGAALQSIRDSRDTLAREAIVIDNGSRDDTVPVLSALFPEARFLRAEANLGFARAANQAARQATGEWLLLLNSDARLQPDALEHAIAWGRAHPDCGVAGAQLLNPDGSPQNSVANDPTLATELLNKSLLRRLFPRRYPGKEKPATAPLEVESVVGAFFLVRRSLWESLGGLDERFFFFLEETDFCRRTRQAGRRVVHLPEVRVWHGQGQTARATAPAARIEYWRSRYRYFQKHHGRLTRALLRIGLLARLGADFVASLVMVALTAGGSARWRLKLAVQRALVQWHVRGCPDGMGLPRD